MNWGDDEDDDVAAKANWNMMTQIAKGFAILVLAMLPLANLHKVDTAGLKPNAKFAITMDWEPGTDSDIDLHVRNPLGQLIFYGNDKVPLMNLDRDERGGTQNRIVVDGKPIINRQRTEVMSIRAVVPGTYIVNVFMFRTTEKVFDPKTHQAVAPSNMGKNPLGWQLVHPHHVKLQLLDMDPAPIVIFSKEVIVDKTQAEYHAFRFTIKPDGKVEDISDNLPASIVPYKKGDFLPAGGQTLRPPPGTSDPYGQFGDPDQGMTPPQPNSAPNPDWHE